MTERFFVVVGTSVCFLNQLFSNKIQKQPHGREAPLSVVCAGAGWRV